MQLWRPECELVGISSGSWYQCLSIRTYHWLWEEGCTKLCAKQYVSWKWDLACKERKWVTLQPAEMRMVRWMCGAKLKDRFPRELRERLGIDDTATVLQQNRLQWYGHVLRWWLGEEMHGVWSRGQQTKRKTKEDLERGCGKGLKYVNWTRRTLQIVVDRESW